MTYVLFCVHNGHVFVELSLMFILRSLQMFLRWILTNINYVHFGRSEIFLETVRLFFIWRPPYQRWLTRCLGPCVWFTVHCETCVVVWFHPDQCEKKWIECYQHNDIQRFDFFFSYIFSNINYLIIDMYNFVCNCTTLFQFVSANMI